VQTRDGIPSNRRIKLALGSTLCVGLAVTWAQTDQPSAASKDAVVGAQEPAPAQIKRPERQKNAHDRSDIFEVTKALP
jgi:hypothetical protein